MGRLDKFKLRYEALKGDRGGKSEKTKKFGDEHPLKHLFGIKRQVPVIKRNPRLAPEPRRKGPEKYETIIKDHKSTKENS